MKKRTKIISSITLLIILPLLGLLIFFYKNDAPITYGKMKYNIKYTANHKLDIYFPTMKIYKKSPVLLFIHGGAWISGRKEIVNLNRFNGAINILRDHGYTIVSPEYTLARDGNSPFPDCIKDGFEAINWIVNHADSLQLDIDNFGIMGESAGSHIAMMNAFVDPSKFGLDYERVKFDYLVDIYGPKDLMHLYHFQTVDSSKALMQIFPTSIQKRLDLPKILFGFNPKLDSVKTTQFASLYSPINYINKENAIPTLMIHGTKDQLVPYEQSLVLKSILKMKMK